MYDKKKTLSSYMGGGYMNPMGYAKGGYRKGLSSALYRAGLNRDKQIAQKEFEEQAKKLEKEQYWRGIGKTLGKVGGTALGALLAAPTGGLSIAAGKALGATLGTAAGGAIGGSGQDASNIKDSSTGLYKDDFEYLREQGRKAESFKRLGQESAIAGGTTYLGAKSGDIVSGGKKFIGDKFGAESLENLGLAGKTDPLLSSLTKDVSTAQAGAKSIIGDSLSDESLFDSKELFDIQDSFLDSEIKRLFGSEALQVENAQLGFGLTESPEMYNDGGYVQGYEDGGRVSGATPYSANITPEGLFQQILSVPASEVGEGKGLRYYLGEAMRPQMSLSKLVSGNRAINKMVTAPQDSIPIEMLKNYFLQEEPQPEKRGLRGLFGMSKGGKVEGYNQGGLIDMKQFGRRIL